MTAVDLQVSPGVCSWPELRDIALEAENLGYGAFHVYDHLAGVALGGETMLECFTLLGALAEATTTIELGTMVINVWNRQVGTAVAGAASVAVLSGRRVHLGIGAGASPTTRWAAEQDAVSAYVEPDLEARHDRVVEMIELGRAQWAPDRDAQWATFPHPAPPPSLIVGVNSTRLSRIAGTYADGINVRWTHPLRDDFLAAARDAAAGRAFELSTFADYQPELLDPEHPDRVAMAAAGIDRLVLSELRSIPKLRAVV